MRKSLTIVLTAGALTLISWTFAAPPAAACSCAPAEPPSLVFEGMASGVAPAGFGEQWTFDVEEVVEGEIGETAEVMVASGDSAGCGIDLVPELGSRYRVGVVPPLSEEEPMHVNLCTGSIELIAAGDGAPASTDDGDDGPSTAVLVVGALGVLTVIGVGAASVVASRRSATGS